MPHSYRIQLQQEASKISRNTKESRKIKVHKLVILANSKVETRRTIGDEIQVNASINWVVVFAKGNISSNTFKVFGTL
jgi:hypothetical protein